MYCELDDGTVVKVLETPIIFQPHDNTRSYKTGARLPKSGFFRNFKNMPTTLNGLFKLLYSNQVDRLIPSTNPLLGKLGRLK